MSYRFVIYFAIIIFNIIFDNYIKAQQFSQNIDQFYIDSSQDKNNVNLLEERKLVLKYIEREDIDKARELIFTLDSIFINTYSLAFLLNERWILSYWINDYPRILDETLIYDSVFAENQFKKHPPLDMLSKVLKHYTFESRNTIINTIYHSELEDEEKEFLTLNLYYTIFKDDSSLVTQEFLNNKSDQFLNKFPNSKYEKYIRENVRFYISDSKFYYGFCFYSGYNLYFGNLNNHFSNTIPFVLSTDFFYNRFFVSCELQTDISSTIKSEFNYKGTWEKNLRIHYYQPQINIGYTVAIKDNIEIIPFIGPSIRGYLPSVSDNTASNPYAGYSIGPKYTSIIGCNIDFKLSEKSSIMWDSEIKSNWQCRIQFGYCYPTLYVLDDVFSGSIFYFLIGINGNRKVSKREY